MCRFCLVTLAAMLCLGGVGASQGAAKQDVRESQDIRMAETALVSSLVYELSPKGQALLCYQNRIPCLGQVSDEMALALVAARNSHTSLVALGGLARFRLDGGNHESYMSYVIEKGNAMKPILGSLSADHLHQLCHEEFTDLKNSHSSELQDIDEQKICRDVSSIRREIGQVAQAFQRRDRSHTDEYGEEPRTEATDVRMAEDGLVSELAVRASPKGQSLCTGETALACLGPDRTQLGLAMLCARGSLTSETALAALVRYRLGSSLTAKYDRCIAERGPTMKKILQSLNPNQLHQQCSHEYETLMKSYRDRLDGLQEDDVCADSDMIKKRIQERVVLSPNLSDGKP